MQESIPFSLLLFPTRQCFLIASWTTVEGREERICHRETKPLHLLQHRKYHSKEVGSAGITTHCVLYFQTLETWENVGRSLQLEGVNLPLLSSSNVCSTSASVAASSHQLTADADFGSTVCETVQDAAPNEVLHSAAPSANWLEQTVTPTKVRRKVDVTSPKQAKDPAFTSPFKNKHYVNVAMTFSCTICDRQFTTQTALQNHIYAHHEDSSNKEFQCGLCSKRFLHKSSMMRHEATHRGRHSCLQCQRTFAKKEDLNTHVKVIHMGVKEFDCQICKTSFGYKRNLVIHLKNIHQKNK